MKKNVIICFFIFAVKSYTAQVIMPMGIYKTSGETSTISPESNRMQSNREHNLSSFTQVESKFITGELDSLTPLNARNNPDYGILPENSPCTDCIELIQKRTETVRHYAIKGTGGSKFYLQQGYLPINYKDVNGHLRAINARLKPDISQPKLYTALNQEMPTKIDVGNKFTSLINNGSEFKFNRNLRLMHKDGTGNTTLLANADWTNYTIGSDGILVTNISPNVDLRALVFEGKIKTDFIVKKSLEITGGWLMIEDDLEIPYGSSFSTTDAVLNNDGQWLGNINILDKNNRINYTIHNGYANDNSNQKKNNAWLGYKLNGKKFEIYLSNAWLSDAARQFPVTIDPLVSSSGTKLQATFNGAGFDPVCTPAGCNYTLTANTPANCTITNIFSWFQYTTFNPCDGGDGVSIYGGFRIGYLGCMSPDQISCPGCSWGCAWPGPVICSSAAMPGNTCWSGANGNFNTCVPPPACAPYPMLFTMNFFQCNYPMFPGCNTACYQASSNWVMTIQGETVVQPPTPATSSGTLICNGMCSTVTATGNWGVPPYTYSWTPGGATTNPAVVCPPPNTTTTYTCIITDACGITATNQVAITTQAATLLTPTFATNMNPASGTPCPVTVTACSRLPSNYGGGSENYSWNFLGGTVTSGGSLSGVAVGSVYGGTGSGTVCVPSGPFYTIIYNSPGTYTLAVGIVKSPNCGYYATTINVTCPVLPIELIDYKVNYKNNVAEVTWQTATEKNSDYFILEKSYDGEKYEFLSKVAAAGNSATNKFYLVNDLYPNKKGITYYLLKQFDKNNTEPKFSDIVTLNIYEKTNELIVIPNPATKDVLLIMPEILFDKLVYIDIYDSYGKKNLSVQAEINKIENTINVNISDLAAGIYFIKATDNLGTIINKKIAKER